MATDCAAYFPHDILDSNGKPTIHKQAKLVKSMLTNKYMMFGSCQNTQHLCSDCITLEQQSNMHSDSNAVAFLDSINAQLEDAQGTQQEMCGGTQKYFREDK